MSCLPQAYHNVVSGRKLEHVPESLLVASPLGTLDIQQICESHPAVS